MKTARRFRSVASSLSIARPTSSTANSDQSDESSVPDITARLASTRLSTRDLLRYGFYETAVQSAEADAEFLGKTYRSLRKQSAKMLVEDFCGTFALCCEWLKGGDERRATGIDLDPNPMAYGHRFNANRLSVEQRARLSLRLANVLAPNLPRADIVCAMNFSYFIFRDRLTLLSYFRNVRRRLRSDGVFIVDAFGGAKAQLGYTEKRSYAGFKYVWEQKAFDPISNHTDFAIHFEGKNTRPMRDAFTYSWRMWTIPEIREVMREAGFKETVVYWEGSEPDGSGNGIFSRRAKGEECDIWIAYIAGLA